MSASRFVLISSLFLAACGGAAASVPDAPSGEPPSAPPSGSATGSPSPDPIPPGAPTITLRIQGSLAPVPHVDGFAGQTAKKQVAAIRSLWLLRSADDPSPVKVFDRGDDPALVDYVTEQPVTLATVARASIPSGTYRLAKVSVPYVRYAVASRLHAGAYDVDGAYDNVQALANDAVVDGVKRARGWYRYAFTSGGATLASVEGGGAPIPAVPSTGGVSLDTSGADTFYVFSLDAFFDTAATYDETVTFEANVHESFRWRDEAGPGYAAGVFDTTSTSFEPVMSFGANAFTVRVERSGI